MTLKIKGNKLIPVSAGLFIQGFVVLAQQNSQRPNIIFIMSDDHAAKAISCYDENLIGWYGSQILFTEVAILSYN